MTLWVRDWVWVRFRVWVRLRSGSESVSGPGWSLGISQGEGLGRVWIWVLVRVWVAV